MINKLILFGFTLCALTGTASATTTDIDTIVSLAAQIKIAAKNTTASEADLKSIIQDMKSHLDILNTAGSGGGGTGGFDPECYNFAYQKYYADFSAADATTKATTACKKVADTSVLKFFFAKFYSDLSSSNAMNEASARAGREVKNKLDMIQFAYVKNYSDLSASNAAIRTYNQISLVRAGNLGCLQSVYPGYYSSMSSSNAMDASANACK